MAAKRTKTTHFIEVKVRLRLEFKEAQDGCGRVDPCDLTLLVAQAIAKNQRRLKLPVPVRVHGGRYGLRLVFPSKKRATSC